MKKFLALCLAIFTSSCAATNMDAHYAVIHYHMTSGSFENAAAYVAENNRDIYKLSNSNQRNLLLYQLDKSYLDQQAGQHDLAASEYQDAINTIDDLWTKSFSAEVNAAINGDQKRPYAGEDHEKVLAHIFAAINYAQVGNFSDARVEARLVGDRLNQYNEKYAEKKNTYKDDAFARWFAGWLLETENTEQATNESKIDYETAYLIYEKLYGPEYETTMPHLVVEDLIRSANYAGIADTISPIAKQYNDISYPAYKDYRNMGQVLFIHQAGDAPIKEKREESVTITGEIVRAAMDETESDDSDLVSDFLPGITTATISYPVFVKQPRTITGSIIKVDGQSHETELVEDIEAIAIQTLADANNRIRRRALVRTISKNIISAIATFVAASAISKALDTDPPTAADFIAAYKVADLIPFETDTRTWVTLPAQLRAGRLLLPAGTYSITIDYTNDSGAVVQSKTFENITVKAGGYTVLSERTF